MKECEFRELIRLITSSYQVHNKESLEEPLSQVYRSKSSVTSEQRLINMYTLYFPKIFIKNVVIKISSFDSFLCTFSVYII